MRRHILTASTSATRPTRLLHIGRKDDNPYVQLRETSELIEETAYTTLSHRWSGELPRLLVSNYDLFKQEIPSRCLTQTFLEAIQFTLFLGIEYIWIDALCIVQDSLPDWELEAPRMDRVYTNSYVNIAATGSVVGDESLFRYSNNSSLSIVPCRISVNRPHVSPGPIIVHHPRLWSTQVNSEDLSCRGWVLQETLLAPRVLHFAQDEIFWECDSLKACQTFPKGIPKDEDSPNLREWRRLLAGHDGSNLNTRLFTTSWNKIMCRYSYCDLTVSSDKLVAVAGIARRLCDFTGRDHNQYLAGLWREDLLGQLLWYTFGENTRCPEYRAPSWSWASLDGPCQPWEVADEDHHRFLARILEARTSHNGDPFGHITNGCLLIQGPMCQLEVKWRRADGSAAELNDSASGHNEISELGISNEDNAETWVAGQQVSLGGLSFALDVGYIESEDNPLEDIDLYLLGIVESDRETDNLIKGIGGLILRATQDSMRYRREGAFSTKDPVILRALRNSLQKPNLCRDFYQDYAEDKGYVIEII